MKTETTTTSGTKTKASTGARRKADPASDAQAQRRARMLELCVALGHVEQMASLADTSDVDNDIQTALSQVALEYVEGGAVPNDGATDDAQARLLTLCVALGHVEAAGRASADIDTDDLALEVFNQIGEAALEYLAAGAKA